MDQYKGQDLMGYKIFTRENLCKDLGYRYYRDNLTLQDLSKILRCLSQDFQILLTRCFTRERFIFVAMKYLHENFIELLKQCVKREDGITCLAKVRINEKRIAT